MPTMNAKSGVRRDCPSCGAPCFAREATCWKCGGSLVDRTDTEVLIDFSVHEPARPPTPPATAEQPPQRTVLKTTLTGEVVEVPDLSVPVQPAQPDKGVPTAPPVPSSPEAPVFRLTYCKTCGIQNDEGAEVCRKCREPLPVLTEPPPDIVPLKRSWGFDLLGVAWLCLGIAAVYAGRFIVKADPEHPGITWADYFWTGIVVCAPGVLVFVRHYLCKPLFWLLTFSSVLVWGVIGFIWLYIGLAIGENGRIGLSWLAALSLLAVISYVTVRLNDEFDIGS